MRTAKEIRQYLRQQKWYKDYVYNVKKNIRDPYRSEALRGYMKIQTISAPFLWDETPQGDYYWRRIDDKFMKWYDKGRKQ